MQSSTHCIERIRVDTCADDGMPAGSRPGVCVWTSRLSATHYRPETGNFTGNLKIIASLELNAFITTSLAVCVGTVRRVEWPPKFTMPKTRPLATKF